jgi:hypothetical protein
LGEDRLSLSKFHSFNSSEVLKPGGKNSTEIEENRRESGLYLKFVTMNPCPKNQRLDRRGACRKLANVE